MGSGEYLSMKAQKELLESEIEMERKALLDNPLEEQRELRQIFIDRGIEEDLADRLSIDLMRDPDLALRTHAREELGVDPSATGSPWMAAISSFWAFVVGAFIPLLPWLWSTTGNQIYWSIGLAAVGAAVVGGAIGWFTRRGVLRSAVRQLVIAALAAAVTYGVGRLVGSN
jgi:VIT1/CCC1 family predicted Fe2+/Mn2+ transporter